METQEIIREFNVPSVKMPELNKQFETLAKKARKLGCPIPSFTVLDTYEVTYTHNPYTDAVFVVPLVIEFTKIKVEGEVLKYAGWTFLGTIEHTSVGNILRSIPGVELAERYRIESPTCNHCRTTRNRKNTYVVRHEDGTEKRVGSSCVGDFLGHDNPDKVAASLETYFKFFVNLGDYDEKEFFGGKPDYRVPVLHFLAVTSCCIRAFGWTSRSKAYEIQSRATADDVNDYIFGTSQADRDMRRDYPVTEEDDTLAEKALEWVQSLDEVKLRDNYLYNINLVSKMESVDSGHYGLAASIIFAYKKEVEREIIQKEKRAAGEASEYIGSVGDKLTLQLVVTSITPIDGGQFGTTYCCKFLYGGRDRAVWFASRYPDFNEGETITLKGTVKAQSDSFHNIKETQFTRCKVIG